MLFTSLLCSSDVVSAVSIVDFESQPKLYSCIFGEGVFNDIVSIVLFNVVESLQTASFTTALPFIILAQFIALAVVSVGFGVLFGFMTALMFKHFRFLTISAVIETFIMLAMGFISYNVAESTKILGLEMSGIISLLTTSIIQSHYTWYNLSPQGKSTTAVTFAFLGHSAEAAIYCYVGLSLFSSIPGYWCFSWIVF
jgi:sodium/hydrogen exchanger-like protein 6/7/sodium/hydrogen exchanger 8